MRTFFSHVYSPSSPFSALHPPPPPPPPPLPLPPSPLSLELGKYFHTENDDENPFICSQPRENGMRECGSVPVLYEEGGLQCRLDMDAYNSTDNTTCVNWNQYYTNCSAGLVNPFKGAINFDNICYAWIAIFQVRPAWAWVGRGLVRRRAWEAVPTR